MKKLYALVMTLCLLAGLMAVTASAEAAAVKVSFENSTAADFSLTIEPGATAYVTNDDAKQLIQWTETEAPTDKFVKLELSADGATLNATIKNIDVDSSGTAYTGHAIEFTEGNYAVVLTVEGENKMQERNSACIKNNNAGGMTITGAGKLTMNIGTAEETGSASGAIWANGGNLTIKNTTLEVTINSPSSSKHHVVYSSKGNVNFEGSKLTIATQGGQLAFIGTGEAKVGRYTLDTATDRFINIKGCDVVINCKTTALASTTAAVISNTTMKVTKSSSSGDMFIPAPKMEGDFSAIAGLAKNADKLDKLKVYQESKLGSYTYFYMVPGIVDLLPTEAPTEPVVTPTEPEATTPEATTPEATTPEATTPAATTPAATTPNSGNTATTPNEGNTATTPNASEPAGDEVEEEGGNALTVVLIVLVVLIVAAGGTFGVLLYLKKKKA